MGSRAVRQTTIEQWATTAKRGDRHVYHVAKHALQQIGALRAIGPDKRSEADQDACDEAFDAWALYDARRIALVQRRVGTALHYEAVRL